MKITTGAQHIETHDTFLLELHGEPWHVCTYPEKPGVLRVRPGTACPTPCEALPLGVPAEAVSAAISEAVAVPDPAPAAAVEADEDQDEPALDDVE